MKAAAIIPNVRTKRRATFGERHRVKGLKSRSETGQKPIRNSQRGGRNFARQRHGIVQQAIRRVISDRGIRHRSREERRRSVGAFSETTKPPFHRPPETATAPIRRKQKKKREKTLSNGGPRSGDDSAITSTRSFSK